MICGGCGKQIPGVAIYRPRPVANFRLAEQYSSDPVWQSVQSGFAKEHKRFQRQLKGVGKSARVQAVMLGAAVSTFVEGFDSDMADIVTPFVKGRCEDIAENAIQGQKSMVAAGVCGQSKSSGQGKVVVRTFLEKVLYATGLQTGLPWLLEKVSRLM